MSNLSIRLPSDTERHLLEEARLSHKNRSEIARDAITEYIARRAKERYMASMAQEMRAAYHVPAIRQEATSFAEQANNDGLDAIITAEQAAGIDPDEKWWN
ncbi:MAG TPA: ribbon-helix-helix protein, CopG family [Gammaproteobacteria bacterium]|nr:ribbon-helix-helix protein, CopG family [Gammaproteobacteria bacterium]